MQALAASGEEASLAEEAGVDGERLLGAPQESLDG
jgi:hypothetical protein